MKTMNKSQINVQSGELCFTFWESGDLFKAVSGTTMINQWMASPVDGSMNNLYLRFHSDSGIRLCQCLAFNPTAR